MKLSAIFENEKILVVDKPAGVIVIPDQHTDEKGTLLGEVNAYAGHKMWVVHRIDRGTTGVIVFAKDAESHAFLCRQFEAGEVKKAYLALVNGTVQADNGVIDRPILISGRKVSLSDEGKESVTDYRVVERFGHFTLVEAAPRTGRRHQIRVHLWGIGHPLAVDPEYGQREALCLSEFKKKYKVTGNAEKPLIARLTLHAARLTLREPASGESMTFEAPLPHDFEVTLKQLRKYDHA